MNLFWRVYFQTCQEIRERTTNLQGSNDKLEADLTDCHNEVQKLKKQLEAMWMNYVHATDVNSQLYEELLDERWAVEYSLDRAPLWLSEIVQRWNLLSTLNFSVFILTMHLAERIEFAIHLIRES